jgi:hypothetical protein
VAGINGRQKKKKEEDKGKKEKYLCNTEDINRVKNNGKGVPRIIIFNLREKH